MTTLIEKLSKRRKALAMPFVDLAARSGVSVATAKRVLSGQSKNTSFAHVLAISAALGVSLSIREDCSAEDFAEKAAREKAANIMRMVQGTSGLEAQAVGKSDAKRLERASLHRLLAGSRKRIWAK